MIVSMNVSSLTDDVLEEVRKHPGMQLQAQFD
ncbi:hypothetical protein PATA110616_16960 [Paenibacillus tarimensis]